MQVFNEPENALTRRDSEDLVPVSKKISKNTLEVTTTIDLFLFESISLG